ncbi:MAG: hypothetical protein ACP5HG_17280, partial [Anaerolineae bacterium]
RCNALRLWGEGCFWRRAAVVGAKYVAPVLPNCDCPRAKSGWLLRIKAAIADGAIGSREVVWPTGRLPV